ncbi:hypothetical protein GCM10009864_75650 [Streptomyces lunalinharesii]|uniref:Uncharacterized protein n=1 Tax=Streptomyces lunalinharesii TaxID=333384 RepID=A0ABN3T0Z5_9ACTN
MSASSTTPAIRNIPPYSSVSRIRMVGRNHGAERRRGAGAGRREGLGETGEGVAAVVYGGVVTAVSPAVPVKRLRGRTTG